MMTKKEQHEFFLKEIQPYVDKKVKEARQEERGEVLDEVLSILEERGYYHKEVLKLKNVKK